MKKQTYYIAIGLIAAGVGALAITNQSFWIDEGGAAVHATQPTLHDWWQSLRAEGNSNLQLLLQQFYLWSWEKIFGPSEIALRASNIPWFVAGVFALAWAFPEKRCLQNGIVTITLSNAFIWYYLSEARPYIVLFTFSALTVACLVRTAQISKEPVQPLAHFRLLCIGVAGMCATSLIAVPWAMTAAVGFAFLVGWSGLKEIVRKYPVTNLLFIGAIAGFGLFYLWTITLGARASDVGRTSLATVAFTFYELLGLAGLGPGRLALRNESLSTQIVYVPYIVAGLAAIISLCLAAWRAKIDKKRIAFFVIVAFIPLLMVLGAGVVGHVRLLGRHLVPLLPFLLIVLGAGVCHLFTSKSKAARALGVGALVIVFLSALSIRFEARHQRDDYRTASKEARRSLADGKTVWWAADGSTAEYYGVPLDSPNLTLSSSLRDRALETLRPPDVIVYSKPDIYDAHGLVDNYLRTHGFKVTRLLPAFQIFERPSDHPQAR